MMVLRSVASARYGRICALWRMPDSAALMHAVRTVSPPMTVFGVDGGERDAVQRAQRWVCRCLFQHLKARAKLLEQGCSEI